MTQGTMSLTSDAFRHGESIPALFTCDGANVSPPLHWSPAPDKTVAFALVVEDPDAPGGTFIHWLLWGIPASVHDMAEGTVPSGAREGRNDFGTMGWGGPCPPRGDLPHRYVFRMSALAKPVQTPEQGTSRAQMREAMKEGVIAFGELTGVYGR